MSMKRILGTIAAFAALGSMATPAKGTTANYEAVKPGSSKIAVRSERLGNASDNPYKRPGSRFCGNQRQYRKKCRQNPSHYSSKKHRNNN